MAAMFIAQTTLLNVSKSFPQKLPSLTCSQKVSRVCFTSATRYPEGRQAADGDKRRQYSPYNADEAVDKTREMKENVKENAHAMKNKTSDAAEQVADKAKETKDKAAESSHEMTEKAKGKAEEMSEKSKENLGFMADKAYEMRENTKDKAGEMAGRTKEYAHEATEKTKDAADTVADKTKDYAHGAKEKTKGAVEMVTDTAQSMGEKAKQTVQGAWGAAKETTHKIKETVVGTSSDSDVEDFVEDRLRKLATEAKEKVMDEEVVDERRRRVEGKDHNKY